MDEAKVYEDQDLDVIVGGATQIGALRALVNTPPAGPRVDLAQCAGGETGYDVDYDMEGNNW